MIGTITLNPSIDKRYIMEDFLLGEVMRAKEVHSTAGGKGINVSRVIRLLEEPVMATGFLGGGNGEFIKASIKKLNIEDYFVNVEGETRNCLAFISNNFKQTEVLEPGPVIKEYETENFIKAYEDMLSKCNILIASGSLPQGMEKNFYATLIEKANKEGKKFLLDTSGQSLIEAIKAKPFFIKPNADELSVISGRSIEKDEDIISVMDSIHEKGVSLIVVSQGEKGAIASFKGERYKINIPKVKAVNAVGSGDSMVAGIAVALNRGYSLEETLIMGAASGTANAMEEQTGYANKVNVDKLMKEIKISKI